MHTQSVKHDGKESREGSANKDLDLQGLNASAAGVKVHADEADFEALRFEPALFIEDQKSGCRIQKGGYLVSPDREGNLHNDQPFSFPMRDYYGEHVSQLQQIAPIMPREEKRGCVPFPFDINIVNQIRKETLNASPIKTISDKYIKIVKKGEKKEVKYHGFEHFIKKT